MKLATFSMRCRAALSITALLAGSVHGAGDSESAERASIGRERAAAEAKFTARDAECRQRFVVSSCLETARQERRKALDGLRARQLAVDEVRRRERVQARSAELASKSAEDARRDQQRAAKPDRAASAVMPAAPASAGAASPAASRQAEARTPKPPSGKSAGQAARRSRNRQPSALQRASIEAEHQAAFDKRQAEAAAHRQEAEEAAARRIKQRPAARSLPVPAAAPASLAPAR